MDEVSRKILKKVGEDYGTPCYVYFIDQIRDRFDQMERAFGGRFGVSFAVKSNPAGRLLERIRDKVATLDVSSIGEAERGLEAGYPPELLTFSGPAKRLPELERAVELGVGEIVCESRWEIEQLNRLAAGAARPLAILIRINPLKMPRKFEVDMAGKASQFGIDEEEMEGVLAWLPTCKNLSLAGFHIYSGTNCLSEEAIAENFDIFIELFGRFAQQAERAPEKLIFGSGFGIPYLADEKSLDIEKLAGLVNPRIDRMRAEPLLAGAKCVLEMGRWLVGPAGYLLTSVINEKRSRGTEIRMCDAGFNNHLAACGLMGSVIRRNWRFWKVRGDAGPTETYDLVGPLCTTIDTLATQIELAKLSRGDILAIGSSGAYGYTASPSRFISHPEAREYLVEVREGRTIVEEASGDRWSFNLAHQRLYQES
jgi:diaminopimelate decarboxylase